MNTTTTTKTEDERMKKITQKTLAHYATLTNQIEALNKEAGQMKADLIDALNDGAKVQPGDRVAEVQTHERRSVSWKEVVIRELGKVYATRVLAATKPFNVFKLVVK